jgi:NAD(P)-dependent dehydrogenase (short-subunit alcohol dehydrogenase family)
MKHICVITGGHGGMAHAIATRLGQTHTLVLASRDKALLDKEAADLSALGIEAFVLQADVRDRAQVAALAAFADQAGSVDLVLHTAGVSPAGADAEEVIATNAIGTINVAEEFFPVVAEGGVMINFSSSSAYSMDPPQEWFDVFKLWDSPEFFDAMVALAGEKEEDADEDDEFFRAGIAYACSKRFVISFTQQNTCRFMGRGVRILSVSPGTYLTPMHQLLLDKQPETAEAALELTPAGRWGRPVEIAALVEFLCSPLAGYICGADILADGGSTAMQRVPQL